MMQVPLRREDLIQCTHHQQRQSLYQGTYVSALGHTERKKKKKA